MAKYEIMSRDFTGYSFSAEHLSDVEHVYDGYREYHIKEGSGLFGDVLVECKRRLTGLSFKIKISFHYILWKPEIRLKYNKRFHWLFFDLWIENVYWDYPYKVIKDDLGDFQGRHIKELKKERR